MLNLLADRFADRVAERVIERVEQQRTSAKDTQQRASALVSTAGLELKAAAEALEQAARRLKSKGDGFGASVARQAYLRAAGAAQGFGVKDA